MSDFVELVKSLLRALQTSHEEVDKKTVELKHFLRKVRDGDIVIPEEIKQECMDLLRKTKFTTHELCKCLHNLTELVDGGCNTLPTQDSQGTAHVCNLLKPTSYEDQLEMRIPKSRVSADSAIGSIGSSISSRSVFGDNRDSSASASENIDVTCLPDRLSTSKNNLSREPGREQPDLDFHNLSVSSLESCSQNVDSRTWDPRIGPVSQRPPERDSVAFQNSIDNKDKSLMAAQGEAVRAQQRHLKGHDDSILNMEDDHYSNKEYDA